LFNTISRCGNRPIIVLTGFPSIDSVKNPAREGIRDARYQPWPGKLESGEQTKPNSALNKSKQTNRYQ
jgi:hypothetical protein